MSCHVVRRLNGKATVPCRLPCRRQAGDQLYAEAHTRERWCRGKHVTFPLGVLVVEEVAYVSYVTVTRGFNGHPDVGVEKYLAGTPFDLHCCFFCVVGFAMPYRYLMT